MPAYRARFVLPVASPPVRDGLLVTEGGRIVSVGSGISKAPAIDLGDVAVLPGLVNSHTHLEFSTLSQPLGKPGGALTEWIPSVLDWRRAQDASVGDGREWRRAAVERGLAESLAKGVTTVYDIATAPLSVTTQLQTPARIAFLELIGLSRERADQQWRIAQEYLAGQSNGPTEPQALSPHAPYTVRWELLERLCDLSARRHVPLAMHLAESQAELTLLRDRTGPVRELLEELGVWDPAALPGGARPLDYLQRLATANHALVVHGNYLSAEEIRFLSNQRSRMTVVFCPRTHAYFAHEPYPLRQMLDSGVRVALGTDSRASNPDLCLLSEMRSVMAAHSLSPADVLKLGTVAGAEALGRSGAFGCLLPGRNADFITVRLPAGERNDPYAILSAEACTLDRVFRAEMLKVGSC